MNTIHIISLNAEQEARLKDLRTKGSGVKALFILGMDSYQAKQQVKGATNGTEAI